MKRRRSLSWHVGGVPKLLLLAGLGTGAEAQMLPPDQSLVRFTRYTSVRERITPGYDAAGLPIGDFTLSPSIDVNTNYTDNVYALQNSKTSAAFVRLAPAASLQSNWSRRSLTLEADGLVDRYATQHSENDEEINLSGYGTQQLGGNTRVQFITRYHQGQESRESQNAVALTERPIRYETATAAIGASQRFANFLLLGEAGITHSNYFDARYKRDDSVLDQDYRDNDLKRLRLRGEIAQSPSLAYFGQVTRSTTNYSLDASNGNARSSTKYELLGGVRFELPIPARGEIGIGYVNANYQSAQFRSFSGLAINSQVLFFPTQLTTVTVNAQRSVNDAGTLTSSGYVALSGGIQVDHELLRSLVLTASAQLERDTFNGADRKDGRVALGLGANYRLNRGLSLRFNYDRLALTSHGTDRYKSFSRNRVLVGIGLRI